MCVCVYVCVGVLCNWVGLYVYVCVDSVCVCLCVVFPSVHFQYDFTHEKSYIQVRLTSDVSDGVCMHVCVMVCVCLCVFCTFFLWNVFLYAFNTILHTKSLLYRFNLH